VTVAFGGLFRGGERNRWKGGIPAAGDRARLGSNHLCRKIDTCDRKEEKGHPQGGKKNRSVSFSGGEAENSIRKKEFQERKKMEGSLRREKQGLSSGVGGKSVRCKVRIREEGEGKSAKKGRGRKKQSHLIICIRRERGPQQIEEIPPSL